MTTAHGPDAVADRLYALPPTDFVPARDAEVAAARAAGDRPRAAELARLRRPTVAAWLVNLLALRRPELLAELLDIGRQLRVAQRDLQGPMLRELANQRRAAIRGLVVQAAELAVEAGAARSGLPTAEVEATLMAAMSGGSTADEVRAGRLLKSVHYAGFGETPRPQLHVVPDVSDADSSETSGPTTRRGAPTAAESGMRSTEPDRQPTGAGTHPSASAPHATEPGTHRTESGAYATEQGTRTTESGAHVTEPGTRATGPGTGATGQGTGATEQGTDGSESGTRESGSTRSTAEPVSNATRVDPRDAMRRVDQARTVVAQAAETVDVATTIVRECAERLAELESRLMDLRRDRVTAKTALSAAENALQEATLALRVSRQGFVAAERAFDRAARRSGTSISADVHTPDE
jgi:hypothetical protein